jgi:F-type H+-transporting ATPase subunit b
MRPVGAAVAAGVLFVASAASVARGQDTPSEGVPGTEVVAPGHGVELGEHAEEEHGAAHVPHFEDINWFDGFIGESDELEEPNLFWRRKGTPPPLGALLLNAGILFALLYHFGRRPIAEALKRRRQNIMHGMDEAARMREEAEDRLEDYEEKLERIDEDIKRVKREMREVGEQERERILKEARERHVRMERDTRLLVEQEMKEARDLLLRETVRAAVSAAEERLAQQITPADQQRLADEYLAAVKSTARVFGGKQ